MLKTKSGDNRRIGLHLQKKSKRLRSKLPCPSRDKVIDLIYITKKIMFPECFVKGRLTPHRLAALCRKGKRILIGQLKAAYSCGANDQYYDNAFFKRLADGFFEGLEALRPTYAADIESALNGDPAVVSREEVILCYPGFYAVYVYRLSHVLYKLSVPLLPRVLNEIGHAQTGVDIHPAAEIGEGFFIDHGTGVVIGETSVVGKNVRIYQGVVLGSLNLNNPKLCRGKKRHPTVGDNVIIYAGAKILGGDVFIHDGTIIPASAVTKG